jgi:hypothetical protein
MMNGNKTIAYHPAIEEWDEERQKKESVSAVTKYVVVHYVPTIRME